MGNRVLVIAVHPDDETLGCGGTLLKHKKAGDEINWLLITGIKKRIWIQEKRCEQRKNGNKGRIKIIWI